MGDKYYVCWFVWTMMVFAIPPNAFVHSADEPSEYEYTDLCFRDDPKIDVCIRKRINNVMEEFHKGNDEFGMREFDPLHLDTPLHFEHKARLIGGKISVKDMMTEGLTTMKLVSLRSKLQNPNKMEVGFTTNFKNLLSSGQYQFEGYLGRMPINANGRYNITFKNVETSYVLKAKLKEMENSTSYVQVESFRSYPPKFGETKIFASDLVPGNAVLKSFKPSHSSGSSSGDSDSVGLTYEKSNSSPRIFLSSWSLLLLGTFFRNWATQTSFKLLLKCKEFGIC
ncbi:PREDICTED: uncharacterized protein LOC107169551 [Diuraphis noxia]|uniref:uncharacterized protein LOC107169551 n=1 Tax=Diuraphis noxia TaxID=143948 RepID=UPI0007638734|nr:PREDICTED: uncharacterized protein LOC107169551 [Diuraphis noxia]